MNWNDRNSLFPEVSDPDEEAIIRLFSRHLVSLSGTYQTIDSDENSVGESRGFSYAGFIISIRGRWFLVTAGHILKNLDDPLEKKLIRITSCSLVDYFGLNAISRLPIPFNYEGSKRFYIDNIELGLDFGLIALSPLFKGLLEKNNVLPVSEENWIHQYSLDFDPVYYLLGLPEVFIRPITKKSRVDPFELYVSPTLISVTRVEEVPDEEKEKKFPRFVARLSENSMLDDIRGMSGGPIFGFAKGKFDQYWIVAIQSSWKPSEKIIYACPLPTFAAVAELIVADLEDDND